MLNLIKKNKLYKLYNPLETFVITQVIKCP